MKAARSCPQCGRFIKTRDADLCWRCRENRKDPYIHTDDELAYHGGWMPRNGVLVPDTPGRTR